MKKNDVIEPRDRQKAEWEAKRQLILGAARELFVEKGFDAVSMREIAKRINHTATAIYSYFPSKDALFADLCAQDFLGLRRAFEEIASVSDPLERLRLTGRAYLEHALANPNQYRLMFMTPKVAELDSDNLQIERNNPDQDAYAFLVHSVKEALATGRLKHVANDPDLIAQILWASMHGIIALHMTHCKDPWISWRSVPETAETMLEIMIRGLEAEP